MKKIKKIIKSSDKKTLTIYLIIRLLIIICLILELFHQEWQNAFLCLLTLYQLISDNGNNII